MSKRKTGWIPMFSPLAHRGYRHLFIAQVAALLGTGLATIALGLLAHRLAGAAALVRHIGTDPLLAEVAWSWLLDALDDERALFGAAEPAAVLARWHALAVELPRMWRSGRMFAGIGPPAYVHGERES